MSIETKNAIIESVSIGTERCLSAWLHLDYGGRAQGFGGFVLYAPHARDKGAAMGGNYAVLWRNHTTRLCTYKQVQQPVSS